MGRCPRWHPEQMRRGWTILLALAVLASGCVGLLEDEEVRTSARNATSGPELDGIVTDRLSQARYTLERTVETRVPSHDEVLLHAVEYHPNVTEGTKTPVVLVLSPYWGNLGEPAQAGSMDDYLIELLVSRGYTVVRASVRGTGASGGCYQLGGPTEIQDARRLVERYHEAGFSNGNVALIGASYVGTTPWQAAITDPPGLRTIVPIAGITDMYKYMFVQGAAYTHGPFFPTYYTAATGWAHRPGGIDGPREVLPLTGSVCPGVAERIAEGYRTWEDGDHDAFWDARNYEARLENVSVPVFLVHGFQDWNVDPNNGLPIFDELPSPKKAWLGQWGHRYPHDTGSEKTERPDWNMTLVAWFDRWLKDRATGVLQEPTVLMQDSAKRWHTARTWPPANRTPERLYLTPNGELAAEPPTQRGAPTMGPYPGGVGVDAPDAVDEQAAGPKKLTFTSPPVGEPMNILGRPTLSLNVSIDAPNGHLVADLYEVTVAGEHRWLGHAILDLAHRDSRDDGEPMPTGTPQPVELTFFPMDAHVAAESRLELVLKPEDTSWIHPSRYKPTYRFPMGPDAPASLGFEVLRNVTTHEAPDPGEVPLSGPSTGSAVR